MADLVLGLLQEGFGVLMVLAGPAQPLWYSATSFALVIPAACLGAWVRAQQRTG